MHRELRTSHQTSDTGRESQRLVMTCAEHCASSPAPPSGNSASSSAPDAGNCASSLATVEDCASSATCAEDYTSSATSGDCTSSATPRCWGTTVFGFRTCVAHGHRSLDARSGDEWAGCSCTSYATYAGVPPEQDLVSVSAAPVVPCVHSPESDVIDVHNQETEAGHHERAVNAALTCG